VNEDRKFERPDASPDSESSPAPDKPLSKNHTVVYRLYDEA
jgi:hypothetical protein